MSFDLTVTKGSYFQSIFILKPTPSSYQDIHNWKFIIKIRPSKYSATVIDSWDQSSSYVYTSPNDGVVVLYLPDTYTDAMTNFGNAVLNIWYYDPLSSVGYISDEYSIRYVV